MTPTRPGLRAAIAITLVAAVAGCGGAPILANPPQTFPSPEVTTAPAAPPADPIPLAFPRDDGPHDRLTEWWYYTGHLRTAEGRRFGFEAVIFRAERSTVPTAWASHLALTDEQGNTFSYAQRSELGLQVDRSPRGGDAAPIGFDLSIGAPSLAPIGGEGPASATPWHLSGIGGVHDIEAAVAPQEATPVGATFGLDLQLRDTNPPVPHDDDGFVDFGPAGSSYYYSRTRMEAAGTLDLGGEPLEVTGTAWFDHQWGDFVSVGGGWDWFAINLDPVIGPALGFEELAPARDITLSVVRDAQGVPVLLYGTVVEPGLEPVRLGPDDFTIHSLGTWTSPHTGRTWDSGWRISVPSLGLTIRLVPTLQDQELDTRATTGVAYWEGSQTVAGSWNGQPIGGEAYVELTRYSN
jgi:predicted secreted hydrolase